MRNKLFNLEIDNLTLLEALEKIDDLIASGGCHHVVTANPEILYRALSDKGLYETIAQASLVTADGQGVLLAGKLLDQPFKARVTGIDLAEALCATSGERGHKIYFLGGKEGISKKAQMAILRRYPNANIVGEHHGYFKNDIEPLLADLREKQPDILLVAMGSPYQEEFILRYQKLLNIPVAIGVGGTLDVFSGEVKRAPELVQTLKLEWAYRILSDPKRWRRTLVLPKFVLAVLKEKYKK
jgi:glycosyltransferase, WecB/TagA/CpsF family